MDYTWTTIALGSAAALSMGISKTGVPGAAILAVLLMTRAFAGDEKLSVGATLPILLVGDVIAVAYYGRHTQWDRLLRLCPYVIVGMVPAIFVLKYASNRHFAMILGWLVLGLIALEISRQALGWTRMPGRWWFSAAMGLVAGFGTMVGNAAGPVMSVFFISRGLNKEQFMGTWAWFFFLVNLSKLPVYWRLDMITRDTLWFDLWIVPAMVAGAVSGRWILKVIPQRLFNPLVLLLAGVASLKLVGLF